VASSESSPSSAGGSLASEAVLAANEAFYTAFESRDFDAMSDVWEHSDRVVCTHPGWRTLRGWGAVSGSWYALFRGPQRLQFILTNEAVVVQGDVGWVTVDENLIMGEVGGTIAALNLFSHTQSGWKLVAHLGTPVAPPDDAEAD
jgi:ketosteroid isomerase-like protein